MALRKCQHKVLLGECLWPGGINAEQVCQRMVSGDPMMGSAMEEEEGHWQTCRLPCPLSNLLRIATMLVHWHQCCSKSISCILPFFCLKVSHRASNLEILGVSCHDDLANHVLERQF